MGMILIIVGIVLLVAAIGLFVFYLSLSKGTSKRLKKELDKEYKGYEKV